MIDTTNTNKRMIYVFGIILFTMLTFMISISSYLWLEIFNKDEKNLSTSLSQVINDAVNRVSFSGKYQTRLLLEGLLLKTDNLAYLYIVDETGIIIAHSNNTKNNQKVALSNEDKDILNHNLKIFTKNTVYNHKQVKEISMPFTNGYINQISGVLKIGIDIETINNEKTENMIFFAIFSIIIYIISLFFIIRASKYFAKPFEELAQTLSASESFKDSVLNSSTYAIIATDTEGIITLFNKGAQKLLGFSADELVGVASPLAFHSVQEIEEKSKELSSELGYEVSGFDIFVIKAKNNEYDENVYTYIRKDDSTFPVLLTVSARYDKNNKIVGYLVIAKDITEQKEYENALVKAKEEAELANSAKSDFVANMSHEIRTPMNALIGLTKLVLDTNLTSTQKNYLEKIYDSSKSLLNILNDILDYSKIEAGKLSLESKIFSLDKVLRGSAGLFSYKANEKGMEIFIDIDTNVPDSIIGDDFRLSQVLNNIIGNSVKFSDSGNIYIEVSKRFKNSQEFLIFRIKDNGIGMSKEQSNKLFSAFSQADTSITRKYGGTGLGLTICKQIINLMGGDIWVDSELGRGSIFYFDIPLKVVEKDVDNNKYYINRKDKNILVVDDQDTSLEILKKILENLSYNVTVASSSQKALEIIKHKSFDIYILDWKMPLIDGIELASIIQKEYNYNEPLIIMVTAYEKDKLLKESNNIKLSAILEKPVTASVIFDTLISLENSDYLSTQNHIANKLFDVDTSIKGARVLLVEDNKTNQLVASGFLEKFGLVIDIANNGLEAIAYAKNNNYDVIFMDLQMPVLDGLEATKRIRGFDTDIPIVAMTAAAMKQDKDLALGVGMSDYISKPIDFDELALVLKKWIKNIYIPKEEKKLEKEIKGFDNDRLNSLVKSGFSYKNIVSLLKGFGKDYKDTNKTLNRLLHKDIEEAKRLIHSIKGSAGNIGATQLYLSAKELETDINNQEFLNRFYKVLDDTIENINNIEEIKSVASGKSINIGDIYKLLQDIEHKISNYEFVSADEIENLNQCLSLIDDTKTKELITHLESLDYDNANSLINELKIVIEEKNV